MIPSHLKRCLFCLEWQQMQVMSQEQQPASLVGRIRKARPYSLFFLLQSAVNSPIKNLFNAAPTPHPSLMRPSLSIRDQCSLLQRLKRVGSSVVSGDQGRTERFQENKYLPTERNIKDQDLLLTQLLPDNDLIGKVYGSLNAQTPQRVKLFILVIMKYIIKQSYLSVHKQIICHLAIIQKKKKNKTLSIERLTKGNFIVV